MKKVLTLLAIVAAFAVAGAGCMQSRLETSNTYAWESEGVTFQYPEAKKIVDLGNKVLINNTGTVPDGDVPEDVIVIKNLSLEAELQQLQKEAVTPPKSPGNVTLGDHSFTTIQIDNGFARPVTYYLISIKDGLLEYRVGTGDESTATTVLSTLKF